MAFATALASRPSFGPPTLLPETGQLAYWWTADGETTLRLYEHDTGSVEPVPIDEDAFTPVGWEPIHWLGDRFLIQRRPEVYFLDRDGAVEPFPLEDEYTHVHDVDPDARRFLYVYYPEGVGPSEEPWTLRIYDRETESTTVLTEHPEQWGHAGFSPDGRLIAFRENPAEAFGEERIVIADVDGGIERTFHVGDGGRRTRLRGWHPDGRRLLLDDRSTGWYRVGLYDWQTDDATWFGTGDRNEFPLTILPDGDRLVTVRNEDGTSTAVRYRIGDDVPGRELDLPTGVIDHRIRLPNGAGLSADEVLLQHESSTRPPRLLLYDLASDEVTTIADTRTDALADLDLVEAEHVTYRSEDGLSVNAILHRPSTSPPWPAIVKIHGGPTTAVRRDFDPDAQRLVHEGYAVLQPNYRGSTDQDRAFEAAIRGEEGDAAVDDVAAGARWLAEQAWIDEGRIAAWGHSAGAYNAAMQAIRHPDLWQVVVPENGGLDRVAVLSTPNQYALRRIIDDPEIETREDYLRERSPVHRAADVGCPVCLIHGEDDIGVETSEEFVARLEDRGWTEGEEFRFEILEDEGHVIQDRERLWALILEVLELYCSDVSSRSG